MDVTLTDVTFLMSLDSPDSVEVSTHVGILPNCHNCPYGKTPVTCEELCEPYEEELSKLEVGSVGYLQPEPVIDVISANSMRGIDPAELLKCPSVLSVIENSVITDDRLMSEINKERVISLLSEEIKHNGKILTTRQFEVLYMTYVDGLQPSEIAPLLTNNDDMYNLENSFKANNITEEEYWKRKRILENKPRKNVTSQTVLFHLRRAVVKIAKESGLRDEHDPVFALQEIECGYVNCSKKFKPKDKNQKFCTVQCRRKQKNRTKKKKEKAKIDMKTDGAELRVCANPKCNVPFVPHDVVQKYCTIKCRKRHYNVKYSITKKKKMSAIFKPVSRLGDQTIYHHVSILIKIS